MQGSICNNFYKKLYVFIFIILHKSDKCGENIWWFFWASRTEMYFFFHWKLREFNFRFLNLHLASSFHWTNYVCKYGDGCICILYFSIWYINLKLKLDTLWIGTHLPRYIRDELLSIYMWYSLPAVPSDIHWAVIRRLTHFFCVPTTHTHAPPKPLLLLKFRTQNNTWKKNVTSSHLFTKHLSINVINSKHTLPCYVIQYAHTYCVLSAKTSYLQSNTRVFYSVKFFCSKFVFILKN